MRAMAQKISTCLWFDTQAAQAAKFYTSIFKGSIGATTYYGDGGKGKKGTVLTVSFRLGKLEFTALNGGPVYKFTPAVSFVVPCKTQREIDTYWRRLGAGGTPVQCGWITDRYGVSWQIVPANIGKLIKHPAAMQAMLGMVKLDIAALEAAARGGAPAGKAKKARGKK